MMSLSCVKLGALDPDQSVLMPVGPADSIHTRPNKSKCREANL